MAKSGLCGMNFYVLYFDIYVLGLFGLFLARSVEKASFVRVQIDCFGAKARVREVACAGAVCSS